MRAFAEDGAALIVALMMMTLLAALGISIALTSVAETKISGTYASGIGVLYAAEGAVERAVGELLLVPDWNRVLDGTVVSAVTDGAPGVRLLPDGSRVDLAVAPVPDDRPWGANNPRWQLYASAPLAVMLPAAAGDPGVYVTVWIADDAGESDGNPLADVNETLLVLAQAHGRNGVRRTIEAAVARARAPGAAGGGPAGIRVLSWREVP